ncbi:unnamed protein product [Phytophthora fragariaefolia]|uniref:Unnamed protein product n=1 Tax=Phytophthora fragariaefolia TaxID=1490495 RepID=A0A9W6WVJ2_9STRA|nr:unnamed protein product [Phytophthora fragariaefolia]
MDGVVKAVSRAYALAASSVQELVDDKAPLHPPVTPLELFFSDLPVVAQIINSRRGQLTHKFDEKTLHNIVAESDKLRREYDVSNKFRQAVKESDKLLATFDDMWAAGDATSKFPTLAEFCRGFASVFPNTASVEVISINCEKSDKRTSFHRSLSLSLESTLHWKQWKELPEL